MPFNDNWRMLRNEDELKDWMGGVDENLHGCEVSAALLRGADPLFSDGKLKVFASIHLLVDGIPSATIPLLNKEGEVSFTWNRLQVDWKLKPNSEPPEDLPRKRQEMAEILLQAYLEDERREIMREVREEEMRRKAQANTEDDHAGEDAEFMILVDRMFEDQYWNAIDNQRSVIRRLFYGFNNPCVKFKIINTMSELSHEVQDLIKARYPVRWCTFRKVHRDWQVRGQTSNQPTVHEFFLPHEIELAQISTGPPPAPPTFVPPTWPSITPQHSGWVCPLCGASNAPWLAQCQCRRDNKVTCTAPTP